MPRSRSAIGRTGWVLALALGLILLVPALTACTSQERRALPPAEVLEYRGQRLDSVNAFVENSIKGPQNVDLATYKLTVDGAVTFPTSYAYADVLSAETTYTKVVRLDCVEGWSVTILWEGVLLSDIIDRSRPSADATTVIFHGADGYTTSLPLDFIRTRKILLAYKMNGIVIPKERGYPFMVVAEEHWGYKWAKWVTGIELSTDPNYRGYWEQRGYSQSGSRDRGPTGQ